MKKYIYLSPLIFLLLLTGCQEEPTPVEIKFKLQYGEEPLVMLQEYEYPDGRAISFSRVSFYISEVFISSGDEVSVLADVDYLDLTSSHSTLQDAESGYLYYSGETSMADVREIGFNIGLTDGFNETKPSDYTSDHPLSRSGEYWTGWESYIYFKLQGSIDMDNDGELDTPLALHIGSAPIKRLIRLDIQENWSEIEIVFDMKAIFEGDEIYDIDSTPDIHSLEQMEPAMELADNLARSIYIAP